MYVNRCVHMCQMLGYFLTKVIFAVTSTSIPKLLVSIHTEE